MELGLYQGMFILGNVARTYIVYRFFHLFYQGRTEKKPYLNLCIYGCYLVLTTIAAFVNNHSPLMTEERVRYYTTDIYMTDTITILMCVIEFLGLLVLPFYYERNVWKNILLAASMAVIFRISEFAAFYIVKMTDGMKVMDIEKAAIFRLIISGILIYAIVFTGQGIKNVKKDSGIKVNKNIFYRMFVLFVPCGICYLLFQFFEIIFYQSGGDYDQLSWHYMDDMTLILLYVAAYWFFWLYDFIVRSLIDTYETILLKKENQYYENQLKNMEYSTAAWKKIRHDLKNHFIVLKGMLDSGEEEQAKAYLDEFMRSELGNVREIQTGNTAIDSILNYKMLEAEQYAVTFDLDIQIPERLDVSSHAMSIILGNAIDNAIEAAEKTEEKSIHLILQYTKGRLLIQIRNPYIGELQKGDSGEYLTVKAEKENHGFGLRNIRETVEKVGGVMNIETKGQKFILTILLYL